MPTWALHALLLPNPPTHLDPRVRTKRCALALVQPFLGRLQKRLLREGIKGSNAPYSSLFCFPFLQKIAILISLQRISIRQDFNSSYANSRESVLRASMWVFRIVGDSLQAKASRRRIATWMGNHVVSVKQSTPGLIPSHIDGGKGVLCSSTT